MLETAVDDLAVRANDPNPAVLGASQYGAMIQRLLEGHVQNDLIYEDARKTIPEEGFKHFEELLTKTFQDKEVPRLMKLLGAVAGRTGANLPQHGQLAGT